MGNARLWDHCIDLWGYLGDNVSTMIHSLSEVAAWLRAHVHHDPVLLNALGRGPVVEPTEEGWVVIATSRRGNVYRVAVARDPATGEPRAYRRIVE